MDSWFFFCQEINSCSCWARFLAVSGCLRWLVARKGRGRLPGRTPKPTTGLKERKCAVQPSSTCMGKYYVVWLMPVNHSLSSLQSIKRPPWCIDSPLQGEWDCSQRKKEWWPSKQQEGFRPDDHPTDVFLPGELCWSACAGFAGTCPWVLAG